MANDYEVHWIKVVINAEFVQFQGLIISRSVNQHARHIRNIIRYYGPSTDAFMTYNL